jgi:hypothetical protein
LLCGTSWTGAFVRQATQKGRSTIRSSTRATSAWRGLSPRSLSVGTWPPCARRDLGNGCGIYGGPQHRWANVATRSLLPGAYARFFAYGTPGGLALAAFGQPNPIGVPLSALGFPSGAGCDLHLSTVDAILVEIFEPQAAPFPVPAGGIAEVRLKLPIDPGILGFTMTTQWLDWSQMATSQAIVWSVAGAVPTLDMALLEGHPQEIGGELSVHLAPVIRFEHQ